MIKIHCGTIILSLMLSLVSCERFTGSSNVAKPAQVVDFPSMAGKSLQELAEKLGPYKEKETCYAWELAEGELSVCYEIRDYAKKLMSSISYDLKPDLRVGSPQEMMELIKMDVEGKEAEKNRRGFFTYNLRLNGKSCFVDIHQQGENIIFGAHDPLFARTVLHIRNPNINLYPNPDHNGNGKTFYEQQTKIDLQVGSVTLGHGNWEVCNAENFTGKCKILDGLDRNYLENNKNFSAFGLGETVRSLRPMEEK